MKKARNVMGGGEGVQKWSRGYKTVEGRGSKSGGAGTKLTSRRDPRMVAGASASDSCVLVLTNTELDEGSTMTPTTWLRRLRCVGFRV